MTKRRRRKSSKGIHSLSAWNTKITNNVPYDWWVTSNPKTVFHYTYPQIWLDKRKIYSGSSLVEPGGWRDPTSFQAYVIKATSLHGFDMSVGSRSYKGETSVLYGNCSQWFYHGTSGSSRAPRASANLIARCEIEALNKLKDGSANVAESIATLNQTFTLIADVATKMKLIWDAIHAKQKARLKLWEKAREVYYRYPEKSRRRIRKRVFFSKYGLTPKRPSLRWYSKKSADAWLELQYGWKPLVSDICAALEAARNGLKLPVLTAKRHLEEEHPLPTPDPAGAVGFATGYCRSGVIARVDAELTSPALYQLDSLSLLNPYSLFWELLPFSFVIDWFIPIGNMLKSMSASFGLSLKGRSTTAYTVMDLNCASRPSGEFKGGTMHQVRVQSLTTQRVAYDTWPLPQVYYKSPFTSATRAATALSLLTQLR